MCWIGCLMKKIIKYTDEKQDNSNYILYDSLRGGTAKMTYLRLTQLAECLISKDGYIIKNRYGDDDLIVFYKSEF